MQNPWALLVGILLLAASGAVPVAAQQLLADEVLEGCASELGSYCQSVTPGEGRVLASLYAHEDKLSRKCEFALYDAAVRLERALVALTYVANECRGDIESLCAGVQVGEGRIAQCLGGHAAELSGPCDPALADVGLKG